MRVVCAKRPQMLRELLVRPEIDLEARNITRMTALDLDRDQVSDNESSHEARECLGLIAEKELKM